ncbi:MAG: hypothetical protein R3200_04345 [Xanthomonadales bacterium]|nr:hypothetical protein [Xanthomonadales bacterium]
MKDSVFEYRISVDGERTEVFRYEVGGEGFELITEAEGDPPEWTELGYRQCPNCPLSTDEHSHCPLALQLHGLVSRFDETSSIDEVEVEARTPERSVKQKAALQDVLASLLDLVIPVCGCPVTEVMKPLSRFHLPLASEEETIFRVTGMYLLTQYFQSQHAEEMATPFEGLSAIYEELHELNTAVAQRLQHATSSDSVKNAIALVDMYSLLIPVLLEDQLAELQGFFSSRLLEAQPETAGSSHLQSAKAFRRNTARNEDGDAARERPAWLRSIADGTPETIEDIVERERALEEIMEKADSLALEPLDDDEAPEESELSDKGSRRAVYKLPDD